MLELFIIVGSFFSGIMTCLHFILLIYITAKVRKVN